jgi:hypothetical protein
MTSMHAEPVEDELRTEPSDDAISDAELTALALSADPEAPLSADAVPLAFYLSKAACILPQWYMPPTDARCGGNRWRTPIIVAIIVAFLLIDAWGLCSTYGQIVLA